MTGGLTESFGAFDDAARAYAITSPLTPRPWINYLGNRRLSAFISQNAGGLLWYREPYSARLSRYHYTAAPGDRPGFYIYVRDQRDGSLWNPHFAPVCTPLDRFVCRHAPGQTSFEAEKNGVAVGVRYGIPPADDVMLWEVTVRNTGTESVALDLASYLEFGLLEFMREAVGWCYLKHHFSLRYDAAIRAIRYDYHVFEAPVTPRMLFGCTAPVSGWDCSRDAFIGRTGGLERPAALRPGQALTQSDLPLGGHACAVLGVGLQLAPGESRTFAYVFALADTWPAAEALLARYAVPAAVTGAFEAIDAFWTERLSRFEVRTGDAVLDRAVNVWIPYNSIKALELARTISTDHMGTDGLRYRDTMQDAMAVAALDPEFAQERIRQTLEQQTSDGGGCFAFFPYDRRPVQDQPHRSDNTVWPVFTIQNWLAETGDWAWLDAVIPYRDGGEASVYGHVLAGLRHIAERCGPRGLPTLFHADWNDGLALFGDERAESVMLGMQLVHACRLFRVWAAHKNRREDVVWCDAVAVALTQVLNSDVVWDGGWYRRLLLSNGKTLGSAASTQGAIFLNPQSWAVISGVGDADGRGLLAMDAVAQRLDSPHGLRILDPPFRGIPEPEDPPLGSHPGVGENGGIFCHANTWAIIAECQLGRPERAYHYFRQVMPEVLSRSVGAEHYQREPYVYVSSIVGPRHERFGEGGISWLTGTAGWMHTAVTQYILGLHPTLDGLTVRPCLPEAIQAASIVRHYRGCRYEVELNRRPGCVNNAPARLEMDGRAVLDGRLPLRPGAVCRVVWEG